MIKVENLNFSYQRGNKILDELSFEVPQGAIYGFLGANGAGKTTTIRILLGLCRADSGKVYINGKAFTSKSHQEYQHIGAMIEEPSLYGNLSGEENLQLLANYHKVNKQRIDEVLDLVSLSNAKHKKTSEYSLGMKQRLGIAQSLLHNPKILILDEPLNGLDPSGIKEIRELLFRLRDEGKTILVSSHLLSEVEKSCDYFCIINEGKQIFSEKVTQMQTMLSKDVNYQIRCNDALKAKAIFTQNNIIVKVDTPNKLTVALPDDKIIADYIKKMNAAEIALFEVKKKENSLEDIFLQLTKQKN